jgi:dipeptidyl aminopeptidase/acylaminoacyl peptidase
MLALLFSAQPAWSACADWDPLGSPPAESAPITANDLIEVTGIGRADAEPIGGTSPLAISPDQQRAAFVLQRADVAGNRYCQALVVIDLTGRVPARVLDRGGDYITLAVTMRGMSIANGFPQQIVPAWSPDGSTIAYLRRDDGNTQLWSVSAQGGSARQITHEPTDILSWAWMPNGHIAFAIERDRQRLEAAITNEGRTGWIYDERVTPNTGFRPQLPAPLALADKVLDPHTGDVSPSDDAETEALRGLLAEAGGSQKISAQGRRAWTDLTAPSPLSPRRLHAVDSDGLPQPCQWAACVGRFEGLWWFSRAVVFMKREGWNDRYSALYRWTPGAGEPQRLLRTDDLLERCTSAGARLLCIRETATHPSHIVAVDVGSGKLDVLFDPNQGIAGRITAHIQRMTWRNALGREVYGDLVLPSGFRTGVQLPTIVTLYTSRGFLRGGTGNEYPIFLFAQRGYAVLSIQNPNLYAAQFPNLKSYDDIYAANVRNWSEARNVQSAIASGVSKLVAQGVADPHRLGITGLSAGAAAVRFALINSHLFAAASLSSCCIDETSAVLVGPAWESYSRSVGYPPAFPVNRQFWKPGSLVLNAPSISTPLLMQLADREALYGIPSYVALRQYRQPVELRVFPDEYHIKWQPAHRAAIYATNLDWFDFWLKGVVDPAPGKEAQYRRWRHLRDGRIEQRQLSSLP